MICQCDTRVFPARPSYQGLPSILTCNRCCSRSRYVELSPRNALVRQVYARPNSISEVLGHGVLLCLWSLDYLAAQLRMPSPHPSDWAYLQPPNA